jgi:hypothetical protein
MQPFGIDDVWVGEQMQTTVKFYHVEQATEFTN